MNTVIRDWYIVSIFDSQHLIGKVLWGYVVDDSSCRFLKDDFICTSKIKRINSSNELITTQTGSLYQVIERGRRAELSYDEFELLRKGFSPDQIKELRITSALKIH